jgi:hypothetical protein
MSDPVAELLTYPGSVAAGELIESAWGNDVVTTLHDVTQNLNIRGVASQRHLQIVGGSGSITTNGAGEAYFGFAVAFAAPPVVMVQIMNDNLAAWVNPYNVTAAGTNAKVWRNDGTGWGNGTFNIDYVAVGFYP